VKQIAHKLSTKCSFYIDKNERAQTCIWVWVFVMHFGVGTLFKQVCASGKNWNSTFIFL